MRAVVLKAKVAGVTARADGSASIKLNSPTLAPEDHAALIAMLDAEATVLIQWDEGGPSLHESKAVWEDKTPSQRLRGAIWALHQHLLVAEPGATIEDFDVFYRDRMSKLTEWVKKKLPKK